MGTPVQRNLSQIDDYFRSSLVPYLEAGAARDTLQRLYADSSAIEAIEALIESNRGGDPTADILTQLIKIARTHYSEESFSKLKETQVDFDTRDLSSASLLAHDKLDEMSEISNRLEKFLKVDKVITSMTQDDFIQADELFSNSGFFGFLSKQAREAKKILKDIGLEVGNRKTYSRQSGYLKDFYKSVIALESNKEIRDLLGNSFMSYKTPRESIKERNLQYLEYRDIKDSLCKLAGFSSARMTMDGMDQIVQNLLAHVDKISTETLTYIGRSENKSLTLSETVLRIRDEHHNLPNVVELFDTVGLQDEVKIYSKGLNEHDRFEGEFLFAELEKIISLVKSETDDLFENLEKFSLHRSDQPLLKTLDRVDEHQRAQQEIHKYYKKELSLEFVSRAFQIDLESIKRLWDDYQENLVDFTRKYLASHSLDTLPPGELTTWLQTISSKSSTELVIDIRRKIFCGNVQRSNIEEFFSEESLLSTSSNADARKLLELAIVTSALSDFANNNSIDLSELEGRIVDREMESFRASDDELFSLEAKKILKVGTQHEIPAGNDRGPKKTWTDKALILNELSKKRAHIPVRQLVSRSQNALMAMKPIWFLQPLTVSQFLPKTPDLFDILIIDEASQMLPEMAMAGIIRAKQTIVVGDDQQMPPSDLWKTSFDTNDEDEETEIDSESILDLASQRFGKNITLKWHYRSRHPDLIRFSNYNFYNNELVLFPSPNITADLTGIQHIKVDGIFQNGINEVEAEQTILQAKQCMANFPDMSLGIVTINSKQNQFVQDELLRLADTDPVIRDYFDRWNSSELNYPFVRNLERVQGDERDIIIISTVYAPLK